MRGLESLKLYLAPFGTLQESEWLLLVDQIRFFTLQKGDYWVESGKVCKKLGFITEGVMRVYLWENERENTCYFLKENQFVVDLDSFYQQKASQKYIQAVTECRVLSLSYEKLQYLLSEIPQLENLIRRVTEKVLLDKLDDRSPLVNLDARQRYEIFLREQGDIALRVPLTYIASYLGITLQSLSRLRKEISQKTT